MDSTYHFSKFLTFENCEKCGEKRECVNMISYNNIDKMLLCFECLIKRCIDYENKYLKWLQNNDL